jgi:hypothetical protein
VSFAKTADQGIARSSAGAQSHQACAPSARRRVTAADRGRSRPRTGLDPERCNQSSRMCPAKEPGAMPRRQEPSLHSNLPASSRPPHASTRQHSHADRPTSIGLARARTGRCRHQRSAGGRAWRVGDRVVRGVLTINPSLPRAPHAPQAAHAPPRKPARTLKGISDRARTALPGPGYATRRPAMSRNLPLPSLKHRTPTRRRQPCGA